MLHHARKSAGRSDTTIWGIATDGKEWKFIRLNADSTVRSNLCFVFGGHRLTSQD